MAVQRSEHEKKYDRQMRLWGGHGQKCIEEAHICVLGSGPAASEVLKDLVLPNIGEFTIVDDAVVSAIDCGNNFFVTQDDVGKKRSDTVTKWLREMNPDVKGNSIVASVESVLNKDDLSFFDNFTIVIATQLFGNKLHLKLANYLLNKNIPYISIKINGLLGSIRVQFPELTIMESHPTNDRTDLFIYPDQLKTFPQLKEYIDSYDLTTKDIEKAAHLPGIAILGQYTEKWLKDHDNKLPSTFAEQSEFKSGVLTMGDGENYDDANAWAFQCYTKPRIDADIREVLNDESGEKLNEKSSNFWVLVRALRDFMENEGKGFLPASTNIPDFHTDPKSYVALKKIFQARYERDRGLIKGYVNRRLREIKRDEGSISDLMIDRFVKNCRCLKVVRTRSVDQELNKPDLEHIGEQFIDWAALEEGKDNNEDETYNPKLVNWYFASRVVDEFYDQFNRLPGSDDDKLEDDAKKLEEIQKKLYNKLQLEEEIEVPCLQEVTRFGGAETHNMGALLGGMAAGSIMKILMKQFFPMNHTFIYNGIHCSGAVFQV